MLTGQKSGQVPPTAVQFSPQAEANKEGDRLEGDLTFGAVDVKLGQVVFQGGKVDEAQGDLNGGDGVHDNQVGQILWTHIPVAGAAVRFGRRGRSSGTRKRKARRPRRASKEKVLMKLALAGHFWLVVSEEDFLVTGLSSLFVASGENGPDRPGSRRRCFCPGDFPVAGNDLGGPSRGGLRCEAAACAGT